MPKKDPDDTEEMRAFLDSKAADDVASYSMRGRAYRTLSEEHLVGAWKLVWDDLEADPLNLKKREIQADLVAEFKLRKLNVPWTLVRKQFDAFTSASTQAYKKLIKDNPEAARKAEIAIEADLQEFRDALKRSN